MMFVACPVSLFSTFPIAGWLRSPCRAVFITRWALVRLLSEMLDVAGDANGALSSDFGAAHMPIRNAIIRV